MKAVKETGADITLVEPRVFEDGEVEWEGEYRLKKWFASQLAVQEEVAQQVVEQLLETYFRPLTIASAK